MLTLKLDDILNLHNNITVQENLRYTNALVIDIDLSGLADDFFVEPSHYTARLSQLSNLLTNNRRLNHLKCRLHSDKDASIPDLFILGLFQALGSLPNPINQLHLHLAEYAFSLLFLTPDNLYQEALINIIKTKAAFQNIEELNFMDERCGRQSDIDWAQFFEKFFCAIPNKSKFKSLTLQCNNCNFNEGEMLQTAIEECNQLTQLSVQGHFISEALWTFIGRFIQSHQSLQKISLNLKSTYPIDFLLSALSNRQLNEVALALTPFFSPEAALVTPERFDHVRHVLDLLGKQISRLESLSRLKLEVTFYTLFQSLLPSHQPPESAYNALAAALFVSVISNPVLSDLIIDMDYFCLNEEMRNLLSQNRTLKAITNKQLNEEQINSLTKALKYNVGIGLEGMRRNLNSYKKIKQDTLFMGKLAQRNRYEPFFETVLEAEVSFLSQVTRAELMSMNSIWVSLMDLYQFAPPTNKILQNFHRNYFMLVCNQFFNQISSYHLKALPEDICYHIAEYTDRQTFAKLNEVTGGYFFRQVKPLTTHYPVSEPIRANSLISVNTEDEDSLILAMLG